jgi:Zn-dependent M28 family amino/carboxypeptidase
MKKLILTLAATSLLASVVAQKKPLPEINRVVTKSETEAHLRFLASDELKGRDTGSPELDIAANYIASEFARWGVKKVSGANGYFQDVKLEKKKYATTVDLTLGDVTLKNKEDLILLDGGNLSWEGEAVFVGYGSQPDMEKAGVKGKWVVSYIGASANSNIQQAFGESDEKVKRAREMGAAGITEIVATPGVPWQILVNFLTRERIALAGDEPTTFPHLMMRNSDAAAAKSFLETKNGRVKVNVEQTPGEAIPGKNVLGIIEGTDPKLKNEYVALTAHYDHVGIGRAVSGDSIYNGTRDNAIGTTAVLQAARYFAINPPKRSILVMTVTAEEVGLLGSKYFADHPLVPMKQIIFNLNCDGAGYNDTTRITLFDLNRTSADEMLKTAAGSVGASLNGDPAPEQGLYDRSDNVSFAAKGVPAVTFTTGFNAFDNEIMKYYHQPADHVSSVNLNYVNRFTRAFVYAALLIANQPAPPAWKPGDKYEAAGKALYGR